MTTAIVVMSSDAAKDGTADPGVAGYMHGRSWRVPLRPDDVSGPCQISINALEFVGIYGNVVTFGGDTAGFTTLQLTDSLTSANITVAESAKAPAMELVHSRLRARAEYKRMELTMLIAHIYGPGNVISDAGSRGYFQRVDELCTQLGITHEWVPPHPSVAELLDDLRALARGALPEVLEPSLPPPTAMPPAAATIMSNASARPQFDPHGNGVRIGESSVPAPSQKRHRRSARNWIAWEHDSDDSSITEADLMARAMAEASAVVAPLPPIPAPVPTPAPAQPPAAHRAASEADQEDPTPGPCRMDGCARPRRVRYRQGIGFPVGAATWVCCLDCDYDARDVDGVRVHTAGCNALAKLAPAPSAMHTTNALTEPAPASSTAPAVGPLPIDVAPSPAPAPAPTSAPAPAPAPAPSQPPAANRAAGDDRVDPAPWPCRTKDCARPRRVRYRPGIGFPVGAFSWVCCLHCAHEAHDVNGVKVHSAECDALAVSAPAPSTVRTADARAEPAPAPMAQPAGDLLSRRLAALERRDIEYALRRRAAAAAHPAAHTPAPPAAAPPPTPAPAPMPAPAPAPLPRAPSPAPTPPSPAPLPHTTRPRPSTARSRVGGGSSSAAGASASARAALARAQSPPAHCSTPGCCRPRKTWRIDPATFFGVQVCCEPCGAAPPGAAATGGERAHSRECDAAEATKQRQQPPGPPAWSPPPLPTLR